MTFRAVPVFALTLLVAALNVVWTAAGQNTGQPQRPVFRGGANVVLVDVYPTTEGRIVEGLERTDFQVFENGTAQTIDQFEFVRVEPGVASERRDPANLAESLTQAADPRNRLFVIFLDHLHVNVAGSHATRRPLVDLLERLLAPNDLFALTTVNTRARDLTFARRTESLERQLVDNWAWGLRQSIALEPDEQALASCIDPGDQMTATEGGVGRKLSQVIAARMREDKVLRHLDDLISYLGAVREARKSVIAFTNGWLLYGPDRATVEGVLNRGMARMPQIGVGGGGQMVIGNPQGQGTTADCNVQFQSLFLQDNAQRMRDIMTRANRNNVTFYPVNPSGMEVFDVSMAEQVRGGKDVPLTLNMDRATFRTEAMRTLAENTDGIAVITNDLGAGLRRIADDMSAYYLIGYSSTNAKADGSYRRIEVKTTRSGVRVRARRGYVAAKTPPPPPTTATSTTSAIPAPLTEAFGVLSRLRPGAEIFTRAIVDGTAMSVVVEIAAARVADAAFAKGADVAVTVTDRAGATVASPTGRIDAGRRSVEIPVTLPDASAGPWRIGVKIAGATGMDDRVDANAGGGAIVGEPRLFRAAPGGTAPIRPAADFQFYRTERVHVEWAMKKTLDRREARLINRTGQPFAVPVNLTERTADPAAPMLAADILVSPLAPGDYAIELTVASGADTERVYVPIRVIR